MKTFAILALVALGGLLEYQHVNDVSRIKALEDSQAEFQKHVRLGNMGFHFNDESQTYWPLVYGREPK